MRSKTTQNNDKKKPGGITGKGFVKGDARINRKGRPVGPVGFEELKGLAIKIAAEPVPGKEDLTRAEHILRTLSKSKNWQCQKLFLEIAFGKVPDKGEIIIGNPVIHIKWSDESKGNGSLPSEAPQSADGDLQTSEPL